jgi:hypothetical protein
MKLARLFAGVAAACCLAAPAHAFTQETHRRIVLDAVAYMKANPSTTNYAKLLSGATRAGYTIDQMAATLGQGAYDVDDFTDTYICGAITGDCEQAPVWGLASGIARYTSYWHFENHSAGQDVHGNRFGGYDYSKIPVPGDVDKLAAGWLYNDHLDDGNGGMRGWFSDGSKYDTYNITERNYRLGGYSTSSMYGDFQTMPFQPVSNLGQYWFQQFLAQPSAQTLGFVLHTTDALQPHHTWITSGNNHVGWEGWVNDNYYTDNLNDSALVTAALRDFTPLDPKAVDIRPLIQQGGAYSYANGGIVLSSTSDADRVVVARKVVPHAIAMVVNVLNRAAERMVQ